MLKKAVFIFVLCAGLIFLVPACGPEAGPEPVKPEQPDYWNVESIEEASEIAGYQIAFPSFIPEGFQRGKSIMIGQLGVPGLTDPAIFSRNVDIVWYWIEDDSVIFVLTQSDKKFGVGNAEPAEICGVTGEKEADPDRMPPRLTFGWSDGSLWYMFFGTLAGPLDEEILLRIACSVRVE